MTRPARRDLGVAPSVQVSERGGVPDKEADSLTVPPSSSVLRRRKREVWARANPIVNNFVVQRR